MSQNAHRIYIFTLIGIVVVVTIYLFSRGVSYYDTSLEERFYHPDHALLKPSGIMGHGLGIIGTLLILIGVFGYIARKRYGFLARFGRLKYWLEFHIFLCTLGPIMILFHTAFKFGGIVSVSFWSMVAVVASGVIGRFIYIQIPRTIEGRELSLAEVKGMKINIESILKNSYTLDETSYTAILESTQLPSRTGEGGLLSRVINKYFDDQRTVSRLKQNLRENRLPEPDIRKVARLIRNELSLNNRIERLQSMQNLFKYWHVAHLPFALIMLVFLVIHVAVVLTFGFKWIF